MMPRSSQAAINLIVNEEDGDKEYYETHYEHWDWPEGASGPTIGIGYDVGYETASSINEAWSPVIGPVRAAVVAKGAGIKGVAAGAWVRAHRDDVAITWDESMAEFTGHELPRWEEIVLAALPNSELLPGDCFGALVSLAYNRGASFNAPGPRDAEMRAIRAHCIAKDWDKIPGEFLSMRRLWPANGDLYKRRGHEAALFSVGLGAWKHDQLVAAGQAAASGPQQSPAGSPAAGPAPSEPLDAKTLQRALNAALAISPPLAVDGVVGDATRAAIRHFQARHGLPQTGVPDELTEAYLRSSAAA